MKKVSEIIKSLQKYLDTFGDDEIHFVMATGNDEYLDKQFKSFEARISGFAPVVEFMPDDEKEEWLAYLDYLHGNK